MLPDLEHFVILYTGLPGPVTSLLHTFAMIY